MEAVRTVSHFRENSHGGHFKEQSSVIRGPVREEGGCGGLIQLLAILLRTAKNDKPESWGKPFSPAGPQIRGKGVPHVPGAPRISRGRKRLILAFMELGEGAGYMRIP